MNNPQGIKTTITNWLNKRPHVHMFLVNEQLTRKAGHYVFKCSCGLVTDNPPMKSPNE